MAILNIPVTKGKATVEIDTDAIPENVFAAIVAAGLKDYVNRGMSKITKSTTKDEDELKSLAMDKATANVTAILDGTIKITGQKKKAGASGAVMTEARRLARNLVKDGIKAAGMKISHVEASVITEAANALLEADPSLIAQATANLEERSKVKLAIDVSALVKESPKLIKAAEERKAKSKDQLSAKQAGMVKPKAKRSEAHA